MLPIFPPMPMMHPSSHFPFASGAIPEVVPGLPKGAQDVLKNNQPQSAQAQPHGHSRQQPSAATAPVPIGQPGMSMGQAPWQFTNDPRHSMTMPNATMPPMMTMSPYGMRPINYHELPKSTPENEVPQSPTETSSCDGQCSNCASPVRPVTKSRRKPASVRFHQDQVPLTPQLTQAPRGKSLSLLTFIKAQVDEERPCSKEAFDTQLLQELLALLPLTLPQQVLLSQLLQPLSTLLQEAVSVGTQHFFPEILQNPADH